MLVVDGFKCKRCNGTTQEDKVAEVIAELEIGREDIHDMKKVHQKTDYKPMMIHGSLDLLTDSVEVGKLLARLKEAAQSRTGLRLRTVGSNDLGLYVVEPSGNKRRLQIEITINLTVRCSSQRVFYPGSVRSG